MADVQLNKPFDFFDPAIWNSPGISGTATKLVLQNGSLKMVVLGNYTYDGAGEPHGTVDTVKFYQSGSLVSTVTNIGRDLDLLITLAPVPAVQYLFSGDDNFLGSSGKDIFFGYAGDDIIKGAGGNDVLKGGNGVDALNGGGGNDKLRGQNDNDTLLGAAGKDNLYGGGHDDVLKGGSDNDKLLGQAGNDRLVGGSGNDQLNGGSGTDILSGGRGADTFIFKAGNQNVNVKDFSDAQDVLDLQSYGIANIKAAKAFASNQGGDTVFDFGNGDVLVLENFHKSDLDSGDFLL